MNGQYILAIILALVLFVAGIYLLGRDGTESADTATTGETNEMETLPINESQSGATTTDEILLESEEDNDASREVEELPETSDAPNNGEGETEEGAVETNVVTYTDSGFSPKTITIAEGETVLFVNESARNMWVASDIHPTHNEYPEETEGDCLGSAFDACTGVASGESWSFTFERTGEWGYHNHLSPSRTGTIVVE